MPLTRATHEGDLTTVNTEIDATLALATNIYGIGVSTRGQNIVAIILYD